MPSGILIIDKPAGWTSMDVCAKVRGIFHEKRVGHGGTLDPMATGVLPVFVGQATRGVEFAENGQKEYVAGLRLGQVTDTQDVTGTTLETRPVTADRAALESLLPRFLGEQDQIPPMYSAVIRFYRQRGNPIFQPCSVNSHRPRPILRLDDSSVQINFHTSIVHRTCILICAGSTRIRCLRDREQ